MPHDTYSAGKRCTNRTTTVVGLMVMLFAAGCGLRIDGGSISTDAGLNERGDFTAGVKGTLTFGVGTTVTPAGNETLETE